METFSVLLALCEGNPPVTGGAVTQSFDVLFDLLLNRPTPEQTTPEQTIETSVIWNAMELIMTSL